MHALLSLLLCILPSDQVIVDHVDIIEINHKYDDSGHYTFSQVIFWDWAEYDSDYVVVSWRLVKNEETASTVMRDGESYSIAWSDRGVIRKVSAKIFRVTRTTYDPELVDREELDVRLRRELSVLPKHIKGKWH